MSAILYVIAFVLLGAGASIGDKIDRGSIVDQPLDPGPLRAITSAAGLAAIAWFIYGFFPFSWWLPLIGIATFAVVGAFIIFHALRSYHAPLVGMIMSVLGFALAIGVVVAGA